MLLFYVILKFIIYINGYYLVWFEMNEYIDNIFIWLLVIFINKKINNFKYVEYLEKIIGI